MNLIKQEDLRFGLEAEDQIKPKLEEIFGNLRKLDTYNDFDFANDKFFVEVKTRRKPLDEYDTWWFDNRKRIASKNQIVKGFRCFFVWNLEDGIYLWEYKNSKRQHKNEYYIEEGGRWDRGCYEKSDLVNVRTPYLIDINNFIFE